MTEQQRERFSDALARLAGDESTLTMLAGMVAEDGPPMLAKLGEQANAEAAAEYARTAHALKGLLSTFETAEPVSDLQPIMDAACVGDTSTVRRSHTKIEPELQSLLREILAIATA